MKRIAPGYYQAPVALVIDGVTVSAVAEVVRVEGKPYWYTTIQAEGHSCLGGEDWSASKKDAVTVLEEICRLGYKHFPGLGLCLNTDITPRQ